MREVRDRSDPERSGQYWLEGRLCDVGHHGLGGQHNRPGHVLEVHICLQAEVSEIGVDEGVHGL